MCRLVFKPSFLMALQLVLLGMSLTGLSGCGLRVTGEDVEMQETITGRLALANQQDETVPQTLVGSVSMSATEAEALVQSGRELMEKGDAVRALGRFGDVLTHWPDHPKALSGVVDVHLATRRLAEANWALRKLEQRQPEAPHVIFRRARWYVLNGQPYDAQLLLEPYWETHVQSRIWVEDVRFYQLLGLIYDRQGRHEQAERVYRAGLVVENNSGALRNNLAYCLILQGRHVYAAAFLEDLERNQMLTPRYAENLALAWVLAGREDRAREVLDRQDRSRVEMNQSLGYYRWLSSRTAQERAGILRQI